MGFQQGTICWSPQCFGFYFNHERGKQSSLQVLIMFLDMLLAVICCYHHLYFFQHPVWLLFCNELSEAGPFFLAYNVMWLVPLVVLCFYYCFGGALLQSYP